MKKYITIILKIITTFCGVAVVLSVAYICVVFFMLSIRCALVDMMASPQAWALATVILIGTGQISWWMGNK